MDELNPYQASTTVTDDAVYADLPPEPEARPFGGWLFLPLLALVLTPLRMVHSIATSYIPMFNNGIWHKLTSPGSTAYHPLWAPALLYEMVGAAGNLALPLVVLVYLFHKSRTTPKLIIIWLALNVLLVAGDALFVELIPYFKTHPSKTETTELARAAISALIWIPYFTMSVRVKETFVRNWPRKPAPQRTA